MKTARDVLKAAVALVVYAVVLIAWIKPWLLLILVALFTASLRGKKSAQLYSHGTSRFADTADLRQEGLLDPKQGLIIGRVEME